MTHARQSGGTGFLTRFEAQADGRAEDPCKQRYHQIEKSLKLWGMGRNIWYGTLAIGLRCCCWQPLSCPSHLEVMGVTNMDHGADGLCWAPTQTYLVQGNYPATDAGTHGLVMLNRAAHCL